MDDAALKACVAAVSLVDDDRPISTVAAHVMLLPIPLFVPAHKSIFFEKKLTRFSDGRINLKYESLLNVAVSRMKEVVRVFLEPTYDDI